MANSQETNVNLKINRVPDKATLEDMIANNQIQPNQLYMLPSEQGEGLVALQTKTLWTNPNPTSSFAAQNITTLDMSEYDYLLIDFNNGDANFREWTNIIKKGSNTRISYTNGNSNKLGTRDLTYINSTSIQFADAYWSGSVLNSAIIPYKIIGIKLVNSQAEVTNVYSTDETVVGRWIDGKPIYRKVFNNLSILCATAGWKEVGNLNFETIVNSYFVCNTTNETTRYRTNPLSYCNLSFYNNKCYIAGTGAWSGNNLVLKTVVVEYTKTTD